MYPPSYSHEWQPSTEKIQGAGAQIAVGKLWPKTKTVLRVYFKNPKYLIDTTGFNKTNVMTWAKIWGREKAIPTFTEEQDVNEANIRVEFVCESLLLSNYYASVCKIFLIKLEI